MASKKVEVVVGTAGVSAVVVITKAFEPATYGYLQTTTEAVARYSPVLCQISQEPSKRQLIELRPVPSNRNSFFPIRISQ